MSLFGPYTPGAPRQRKGRKLPKRTCPTCGRRIAQMPTRPNVLRAHTCVPQPPAQPHHPPQE